MLVLPCSGISLLFFEIYKGVFYVQETWLSLNNTGQPFIVPFRRTIIVSSRPYSQMMSRERQKFNPWNFYLGTEIEPGTFVLVVRCTNNYTTAVFVWITHSVVVDIMRFYAAVIQVRCLASYKTILYTRKCHNNDSWFSVNWYVWFFDIIVW